MRFPSRAHRVPIAPPLLLLRLLLKSLPTPPLISTLLSEPSAIKLPPSRPLTSHARDPLLDDPDMLPRHLQQSTDRGAPNGDGGHYDEIRFHISALTLADQQAFSAKSKRSEPRAHLLTPPFENPAVLPLTRSFRIRTNPHAVSITRSCPASQGGGQYPPSPGRQTQYYLPHFLKFWTVPFTSHTFLPPRDPLRRTTRGK